MKRDRLVLFAALSAALAIAAGAFGAHIMTGEPRELLRTGSVYQLLHSIAAIALATRIRAPAWTMLGGATIFALSLYALALGAPRIIGAVTPFGGLAMIAGWLWLALSRPS